MPNSYTYKVKIVSLMSNIRMNSDLRQKWFNVITICCVYFLLSSFIEEEHLSGHSKNTERIGPQRWLHLIVGKKYFVSFEKC